MSRDVGVGQLVEELEQRGDRLPFEIGAFVALEACEGLLQESVKLEADDVRVTPDGSVVVAGSAKRAEPDEAARSLISVLSRLLVAAGPGVPPYLLQLVREHVTGETRRDLRHLHDAIEASLIPLNRGASRRVLARLVRESDRPPAPQEAPIDPRELDAELDELLRDPASRSLDAEQGSLPLVEPDEPVTARITMPRAVTEQAAAEAEAATASEPAPAAEAAAEPAAEAGAAAETASASGWAVEAERGSAMATALEIAEAIERETANLSETTTTEEPAAVVAASPEPVAPVEPTPEAVTATIRIRVPEAGTATVPATAPATASATEPATTSEAASAPESAPESATEPAPESAPVLATASEPATESEPAPEPASASAEEAGETLGVTETEIVSVTAPELETETGNVIETETATGIETGNVIETEAAGASVAPPVIESATATVRRWVAAPEPEPPRESVAVPEPRESAPSRVSAPHPPKRRASLGPWLLVLAAGLGVYALVTTGMLDALTKTSAPSVAEAPAPTGTIHLTVSPAEAQIFIFIGRGPAVAEGMSVTGPHEFVVFDRGLEPSRAVVPKGATWTRTGPGPLYELAVQARPLVPAVGSTLALGAPQTEATAPPDSAERGTIRVITNPPGAKVYRFVSIGPTAEIGAESIHEGQEVLVYHPEHAARRAVIGPSDWRAGETQTDHVARLEVELPPLAPSTGADTPED